MYDFDLLWLDGQDLRKLPRITWKQKWKQRIQSSNCIWILYARHVEGSGKEFFQEICRRDLEGIVAKTKLSVYRDDGTGWQKIKNPKCSQAEGRHELLTRKGKPRRYGNSADAPFCRSPQFQRKRTGSHTPWAEKGTGTLDCQSAFPNTGIAVKLQSPRETVNAITEEVETIGAGSQRHPRAPCR